MGFNIADLFERAVDAVPDRLALVCGDRRLTYAEFEEEANRLANHLLAEGFGHGDHVGIYGQNSAEWLVAMVAIFKIRAVPININFRYVEDELAYLFDNADLVAVVHDRQYGPHIAAVRPRVPGLRHLIEVDDGTDVDTSALGTVAWDDVMASSSPERPVLERSDDDHYVIYTGGTTGMPKGVVWRHEDVFYALGGGVDAYTNERVTHGFQLAEKAASTENPMISLNTPPLMHGAAQWGALRFLFEGGTVVFVPRFDPAAVWTAVERDHVNTLMITGDAMARPLVEALEEHPDAWDLSSLFVLSSSAAIFSPTVKEQMLDLLPNIIIVDAIGSSESGMNGMAVQTKGQTATHGGGGPTVQAGRDAVVLDDDLNPLPPGTGWWASSPGAATSPSGTTRTPRRPRPTSWWPPTATATWWPATSPSTRPTAPSPSSGGARCASTPAARRSTRRRWRVLKDHPEVYDTLVVGVPDDRWGQAVCAVVQPRHPEAPPSLDELNAHCRQHLAAYKTPKHLVVVDEVVRSPAGKPDYPWAAEVARAALASAEA
ncbi:MAG: AMP-binding protein [Acidimicrobiales bacterium]